MHHVLPATRIRDPATFNSTLLALMAVLPKQGSAGEGLKGLQWSVTHPEIGQSHPSHTIRRFSEPRHIM